MSNHPHILLTPSELSRRRSKKMFGSSFTSDNIPSSFSLKSKITSIYDQGNSNSCTANAICQHINMIKTINFNPSRMYLYYQERYIEAGDNTSKVSDSGADPTDGLSWAVSYGICQENTWPFDLSKVNVKPPVSCDEEAKLHKISNIVNLDQKDDSNYKTNTISAIKSSISKGFPVLVGVSVYESFYQNDSNITGKISLPDKDNEKLLGGHEILLVGFDDNTQQFTFVNSWGSSWGDNGFGYLLYDFIGDMNLAQEFRYFQGFC